MFRLSFICNAVKRFYFLCSNHQHCPIYKMPSMIHQGHTLSKNGSFLFGLSLFGRVNQTLCWAFQLRAERPQPSLFINIITHSPYLFYLEHYSISYSLFHFLNSLLNNHLKNPRIGFSSYLKEAHFFSYSAFPNSIFL